VYIKHLQWFEVDMSKYEPLERYLRAQHADEVPMTFAEIERILGAKLPSSKFNRAWWSNNPNNNVMTLAWRNAGYLTEKVDIKNDRVVFRRIGAQQVGPLSAEDQKLRSKRWYGDDGVKKTRHPLFGWMKGSVSISVGVDLTEPADPEWADRLDK
jgi:hypothetical protein